MLRAVQTVHAVSIKHVRRAIAVAESRCNIRRLLLNAQLLAGAGELFLKKYGDLVSLSESSQLAMGKTLKIDLGRVERDEQHLPIRLYPTARDRAVRSGVVFSVRLLT